MYSTPLDTPSVRGWTRLWMLVAGLLLSSFLSSGCKDPATSSTATPPAPASSTTAAPAAEAEIRFTDVTSAAGVHFRHEAGASGKKWYPETMGAGGGFLDYDGDGLPDILLINGRPWGEEPQHPVPTMRLYRNQGDGTFADVTQHSGLAVPLYGMGLVAADYDNDGYQDVLVTGYRQTRLFHNTGQGTFTDVTASAGIIQGGWSMAAVFVDVDRDGWLDLVVGHYVDWEPRQEEGLECTYGTPHKDYCAVKYFPGLGLQLYHNKGDGHFVEVTTEAGMAAPGARVLGVTVVDYNQDGWPDVLVANDLTPSLFFANQGNGTFREIGVQSGLVLDEGGVAFAGMGIDTAYINNDAQLCVAIGNFSGQPTTLHCQARSGDMYRPDVFTEQSHRAGIARPTLRMVTFGLFFFDADLDGWPDLFMANGHVVHEEHLRNVPYAQPPQLLRNRGDGTFVEVIPPPHSGLDRRLVGRGAAYADYDNDGDLDLLLTANQGPAVLLRNDTPRHGHWLRVVTRGTRSNRDGIGARLRLVTTQRHLAGMVRTGSSYLSQSALAVTFGVQPEERLEHLEVHWPSGALDVFRDVPLDTTFTAHEGAAPVEDGGTARAAGAAVAVALPALKSAALAHYQAGRLPAAITAWQQVLQQQPTDYIAQQYLIELYWRQGEHQPALALLNTLSQAMADANFVMQFAFHLEELHLRDLADEAYKAAMRLDPHLAEASYRLGKNALQANRYSDAISYFRQALQRHPGLRDAAQGIGLAYAAQGQTTLAEAQFQEVLHQNPDFAEAYTHLGKIYTRTNRLEEAVTAYRTVVRLQPDQAQGYHNLGTALAAQGRVDEAMAQWQEALRRNPHYVAAHNDLGALYAERGELPQAMAEFQAALQSDATSVPARYNLAMAYGGSGDVEAMRRELQETLRLDPQHFEAHLNLGLSYLQQGQAEAAVRHLRTVVELAPHLADAHYLLAMAYAKLGQTDAMLAPLQQAVRLDPQHAKAHSALATLYFARQQYDLAQKHAQQAAQLGAPVSPVLDAIQRLPEPAQAR